jgi:hypothetical protein
VINVHERKLNVSPTEVGTLIDSLASDNDLLWPLHSWPRMEFDRPLAVGATGGHGPIRYVVEAYNPGRSIRFRFLGPKGFDGFHGYDVLPMNDSEVVLRHVLEMRTHGLALVTWPLAIRPIHDALIEDSLTRAEASLRLPPTIHRWSLWVKILRWIISGGRAREQVNS